MTGREACAVCEFFDDRPDALERRLPGLAVLSSAHAATRKTDGLCSRRDRHVGGDARCDLFTPKALV